MRETSIHSRTTGRARTQSGFTLVEVIIGVAMLGLISVAVASISITGVLAASDDNVERQLDATTAQWAAQTFARDVQGASGVVAECAPGEGEHLVTLVSSDEPTERIEYRRAGSSPWSLVRVSCDGGSARTVIDGLGDPDEPVGPPVVTCPTSTDADAPCVVGTAPRTVSLTVSRTETFGFELDGVRRTVDGADLGVPPSGDSPSFIALGGGGGPLHVKGSALLRIQGDVFINALEGGGNAVTRTGNSAQLQVPADRTFALQDGAGYNNLPADLVNRMERFSRPIPDPLRTLPAPDVASLPVRDNCPVQGDRRVCQPGRYAAASGTFPPATDGNPGVKNFELRPGVYALQDGLRMTSGSIESSPSADGADDEGVMLFNQSGAIDIGGSAAFNVRAMATGTYAGVLVFQPRTNTSTIKITGNSSLAALSGTIYAPGSSGVELGVGNGELFVGRVIGTSLSVDGNGTVIVGGS